MNAASGEGNSIQPSSGEPFAASRTWPTIKPHARDRNEAQPTEGENGEDGVGVEHFAT